MSQRFTSNSFRSFASTNFPGSGDHAVAGWMYIDTLGAGTMRLGAIGLGNDYVIIGQSSTSIFLSESTSLPSVNGAGDFYTPTLNVWTHYALVYTASTHAVTTYINGVLHSTGSLDLSSRANLTDSSFFIGTTGGSDFTAQDLMVFTQALTASQVQECMRLAAPSGVTPYAWFKLLNSAPTTDSSGNSHTLSGAGDSNGTQILISASGTTSTSGASGVTISYGAAGVTNATGAVSISKLAGLVASSTTNVTGSSTVASSASAVGSGSVQTTGGASVPSTSSVAGAGAVNATGSAGVTSAAPAASSGTTQTTGSAAVTQAGQFLLNPAGITQAAGAVTLTTSAALSGSGQTQITGSATVTFAQLITAAGVTISSGSAVVGSTLPSGSNPGRQTGSRQRLAMPFTGRRQVRV